MRMKSWFRINEIKLTGRSLERGRERERERDELANRANWVCLDDRRRLELSVTARVTPSCWSILMTLREDPLKPERQISRISFSAKSYQTTTRMHDVRSIKKNDAHFTYCIYTASLITLMFKGPMILWFILYHYACNTFVDFVSSFIRRRGGHDTVAVWRYREHAEKRGATSDGYPVRWDSVGIRRRRRRRTNLRSTTFVAFRIPRYVVSRVFNTPVNKPK